MIDDTVKILGKTSFGDVRIDAFVRITADVSLGDYVHISSGVNIIGGGGRFTAKGYNNIMTGATIICSSDRFNGSGLPGSMIPKELKGRVITEEVVMEKFSNLGTNAVMMPGSRLRKGALLTIGSVLFGYTVEWGVYEGNPAKCKYVIDGSKIIENAKKLGYEEGV